jgi:hypothetical protein
MYHIEAIYRRLGGRSSGTAVPDHGLSVPYIRKAILLALLREPGMEAFAPLASGVVDGLRAENQYDLYDVVALLIHVGVRKHTRPMLRYTSSLDDADKGVTTVRSGSAGTLRRLRKGSCPDQSRCVDGG